MSRQQNRERIPNHIKPNQVSGVKGEKRFYWGSECKDPSHHKDGKTVRYSSSGECVYCRKANRGKKLDKTDPPSKMVNADRLKYSKEESLVDDAIYGWDDL